MAAAPGWLGLLLCSSPERCAAHRAGEEVWVSGAGGWAGRLVGGACFGTISGLLPSFSLSCSLFLCVRLGGLLHPPSAWVWFNTPDRMFVRLAGSVPVMRT